MVRRSINVDFLSTDMVGWQPPTCCTFLPRPQASLERKSLKSTGPSEEELIERTKKTVAKFKAMRSSS